MTTSLQRMPYRLTLLVGAVICLWMATGCGGPGNRFVPDAPPEQIDPLQLRGELKEMAEVNLELRRRLAEASDARTRADLADRIKHVEYRQSQRLDRIFDLLGNRWPDVELVGKKASRSALVVAQQIDSYRGVQRRALRLLKSAARDDRAPMRWVAFLEDRVRLSADRPQLYGTQVNIDGGEVVPLPIADPERLDQRRADMGLVPMEQYLERVRSTFDLTDQADQDMGPDTEAHPRSAEGR